MNPEINNKTEKPNYATRRLGLGILLALALLGSIKGIEFVGDSIAKGVEKMENPYKYSDETQVWIAESGDGLLDAAADVSQEGGSNEFDQRRIYTHIADMPENESALADGLQAGEMLKIPVSVEKNK